MEIADCSIKPEDDDDEGRRRMNDEMRGLMCGTAIDLTYDDDDETPSVGFSGESTRPEDLTKDSPGIGLRLSHSATDIMNPVTSQSDITCNVCTTRHMAPIPVCCESCCNVLEPAKLTTEQVWTCDADQCQGAELGYANIADAGRCGICGAKRRG